MSQKSATVIMLEAFGAHFIKEITRAQLMSATKSLIPQKKKKLQNAEKCDLYIPLGRAFVQNGIVHIKGGSNIEDLSRGDVSKVGTF